MKRIIYLLISFLISEVAYGQSIDESFSRKKMAKDLQIFKNIRMEANSGLYKYRSKLEIDSIYTWAENQIKKISTYREFYNLICKLTDFEGSLHNDTELPEKYKNSLRTEQAGYFPYAIKWVDGKWLLNQKVAEIPLGAELININQRPINKIIEDLYKYYTTDGVNKTGKRIGINYHFSKYYRINFGLENKFEVRYKLPSSQEVKTVTLASVSYTQYYTNVQNRYSKPFDHVNYTDWDENEIYRFGITQDSIGILTIHSFSMGNKYAAEHKRYISFLDSVFADIKRQKIKDLIVDVRYNGGGTDPNDLVTYSYLAQRSFQENTQAWISFRKVPMIRYAYTNIPRFLRPLGVRKYNRDFQEEFPLEIDGKFFQDSTSEDHAIRKPNRNAFTGNIYLLISPRLASAGSLFAAMVTGNKNSITIGEEAMGGYYGHNGHSSLGYILPKSGLGTFFSVVNLEQDVPEKENQLYNRGVIPDISISQTYEDFIDQKDTQMEETLKLIRTNKHEN